MKAIDREEAKELLKPYRESLMAIVEAADYKEPVFDFLISKTSRANLRHDAMSHQAAVTLDQTFYRIPDPRTCMWGGDAFVLRFRKIEKNGSVGGYATERASHLKQSGQLQIFQSRAEEGKELPIFSVGYLADDDTGAIEDFLISAYEDGKPAWVMSLSELYEIELPTQVPLNISPETSRRTTVRVKDDLKATKGGDDSAT
ncbi:hypothetical protein FRC98_18795 [Lujinxingia vulgaris]|uniref:Uncharacterized protein n=1 Tax=Lujinxingia vulgaris TaxID=2600176 RepID=A0A5C6WXT2_9DELT|nr:hypothetical protein [Lujinxingia vulgaris]TXD34244.1 hypothetical protein FRC98_18795 [Lujinxingia vulgaris]